MNAACCCTFGRPGQGCSIRWCLRRRAGPGAPWWESCQRLDWPRDRTADRTSDNSGRPAPPPGPCGSFWANDCRQGPRMIFSWVWPSRPQRATGQIASAVFRLPASASNQMVAQLVALVTVPPPKDESPRRLIQGVLPIGGGGKGGPGRARRFSYYASVCHHYEPSTLLNIRQALS